MGNYSIKELERLSGIKAHTIRIWESRYQLISPKRTSTNIRYYSDQDLRKLLNVSILNQQGYKISKISKLSTQEIAEKVESVSEVQGSIEGEIERLVLAMVQLDELNFEKQISNLNLRYGFEDTVLNVIYPFLEKIGILWLTGNINPAHEHFISNLIRQKVIVAIDSLPLSRENNKPTFLLYLPEDELHELGLLFMNYIIRKQSFNTIYLGQAVPYPDLKRISEVADFDYLVTYIVSPVDNKKMSKYLTKLSQDFSDKTIYISGYQAPNIQTSGFPNITVIDGVSGLKEKLSLIQ